MRVLGALVAALLVLAAPQQGAAAAAPSTRSYVVALADGAPAAATAASDLAKRYGGTVVSVFGTVGVFTVRSTEAQAAAMRTDPAVAFSVGDRTVATDRSRQVSVNCHDLQVPSDQCLPENVKRIGGDVSSQRSGDEKGAATGVRIAILDSGLDDTDIDLNVASSVDCLSGTPVVGGKHLDKEGHGTEVGGVAAAVDDNQGVVGVAPGAPLVGVRVLDAENSGDLAQIVCGVDYVTSTLTNKDRSDDIDVVNMSLSGSAADIGTTGTADDGACGLRNHDVLHLAICRSIARGAVYSVAAGNDAVDISTRFPAGYHEVITSTGITDLDGRPGGLGGTDCFGIDLGAPIADDTPVFFSNYAISAADRLHTVAAVGSCIITTYPDYYTAVDFGTSFAAPATTGVIALCVASGKCPRHASAATIVRILAQTSAYNLAHRGYGYAGDPLHSKAGDRYYGFLVSAAPY